MKILDTLSKNEKELDLSHKVRIYLCGVTVYDESHIGHARTIIVFDVLRKWGVVILCQDFLKSSSGL